MFPLAMLGCYSDTLNVHMLNLSQRQFYHMALF